jgi:hypothetical protein
MLKCNLFCYIFLKLDKQNNVIKHQFYFVIYNETTIYENSSILEMLIAEHVLK